MAGLPPSCDRLETLCGGESCCTTIAMVGGTFKMGRSEDKNENDYYPEACNNDENCNRDTPEHTATVGPFTLDKYEVTVGRFRRFMEAYDAWHDTAPPHPKAGEGENPNVELRTRAMTGWNPIWTVDATKYLPASAAALGVVLGQSKWEDKPHPPEDCNWTEQPGAGETFPITCVSWYDAFAFCIWDGGWLPTEAEWEFAAAGGTENRRFPWGKLLDQTRASYHDSACSSPKVPVGSYPAGAGAFGHLDLAGSVYEWVFDVYQKDYHATEALPAECNNCACVAAPSETRRVIRGGSWGSSIDRLRASHRYSVHPDTRDRGLGFRCARPVP